EIFQHKYYHVKASGSPRMGLGELQAIVQKKFPSDSIRSIRFMEKEDAAYIFITKANRAVSVNPYTGTIIGTRNTKKDFFNVVLRLHRTLLMGHTGEQIV